MRPTRIDFAPPSLARALARTAAAAWLLAGVGLLLCVVAAVAAVELARHRSAQQLELDSLRAALSARAARRPPPVRADSIPQAQAGAVNAAVAQLNLPWRDLWDAFEQGTPASIALLALEPDARQHAVKGLAEAKTSDAMLAYIEQLRRQAFFRDVVLTRHEINEQDPNKPLRFQFEVLWARPAP